jgi:hypothetical protein
MMEEWVKCILSFCKECGDLLPKGLGEEFRPTCPICDHSVEEKNQRLEGIFSEEDAKYFLTLMYD